MTWQQVVGHVNGGRIRVESKDGNVYPAETPRDALNDTVYSWSCGNLTAEELWAWVDFDGDAPTVEELSTGHPSGGPPEGPPGR